MITAQLLTIVHGVVDVTILSGVRLEVRCTHTAPWYELHTYVHDVFR
jgi:hypothetical protein